jgi:hypothetical protein
MDKYSTVYVPDRNGNFKLQEFEEDYHEWRDVHSEEALSAKSNVIVLTIEEAFDLWSAGQKRGWAEALHGEEDSGEPNFEPYLKSKGINITENGK